MMNKIACRTAKFSLGTSVEHKVYGFRGVVFDVDPEFDNSEDWYNSIPEDVRPDRNQPFYHLFAVNADNQSPYIAYVSEQNLKLADPEDEIDHPSISEFFETRNDGAYIPRDKLN
ncbi:heat shock protein HspQ [Aestuariispira ectoiniformans]|uniref:heat shock protein HspQ n=1 Tax=Aestuariispira ectoiniformans TaxID=2775080 RepID=UPI00223B2B76|nr:heat shock protein HspQ [Aestuariispira ectoiniformans]